MEQLNVRLASDDGLRSRLAVAIADYKAARDGHDVIDPAPAPPGGGPDRVKCLHAHVAHHLVAPNPVGALVLSQVGFPDCRLACVEPR